MIISLENSNSTTSPLTKKLKLGNYYGPPAVPTLFIESTSVFEYNEEVVQHHNRWRRGELLGKGGSSSVFKLTNEETGEVCAGKVITKAWRKNKKNRDHLRSEIHIHRQMKHENIVKFFSCFEMDDFLVIRLEMCEHLCMATMLKSRKRLTEVEARYYLSQIVKAVEYMHTRALVVHRDLKLGNIFLTKSFPFVGDEGRDNNEIVQVKIGDFGLAAQLSYQEERRKTICGTPNYIAPEVLDPGEVGYSYSADIWALGVILYTMLIGKPPFETTDIKTTYSRIRDSIYTFPENVKISEDAKDLITCLLKKRPEERPSLDDISKHLFFTRHPSPKSFMEPKNLT